MSIVKINQAILAALGLDKERELTGVELSLTPDGLPQLKMTRAIIDAPTRSITHKIEWREAFAAEPVAFDVDAECAAVLARINAQIEAACAFGASKVEREFSELRRTFDARMQVHIVNTTCAFMSTMPKLAISLEGIR